ncbi:MAG TPA: hypothetical protein VK540_14610 [Polyangiaceae bacterium]|nr:hypothetical protein [Polyangiaceae bacterium]
MRTGHPAFCGPLRRQANYIIAIFLLIHIGLVLRATVPGTSKLHGPWPWRMFERRGPWERVLHATGTDRAGARHELPLHRIFGYARGMTRMYAYQQLDALGDPAATAAQSSFAAFLARRMAELGSELSIVDLRWVSTNLDTGETEEHPIGTFGVGARP